MSLKTSDFYYDLPEELIAQTPAEPRDSSRLLIYHRKEKRIEHKIFRDIADYLKAGDLLVVNRTKVLPARLFAHTANGGRVEVLLLKRRNLGEWEVLVRPGKKCKIGTRLVVNEELSLEVTGITDSGERYVRFFLRGRVRGRFVPRGYDAASALYSRKTQRPNALSDGVLQGERLGSRPYGGLALYDGTFE